MQALKTAKGLDWRGWIRGVIGATVSGGASAVGAGFGTIIIDPKDFNVFDGGASHLFLVMAVCFAFSSLISLMKFLSTHPIPDEIEAT